MHPYTQALLRGPDQNATCAKQPNGIVLEGDVPSPANALRLPLRTRC